MEIRLNQNEEIIDYAAVGSIEGGQQFDGEIPEDFVIKFRPKYYSLSDGAIIKNPAYTGLTIDIPAQPSAEMQAINALGLIVAQMQMKEATTDA